MITVEHLSKHYGAKSAVTDVSFCARGGEVTGFLGPNGAGKSTTMRLILGLDRPSGGVALVNGRHLSEAVAPLGEVGALLDARGVDGTRSARAHLWGLGATVGIGRRRVDEVLALCGLSDVAGQRVGSFSLGMCQRLGIAAALLADPGVVILDEPANGLDPDGILWIRDLLRKLAQQGRTVLLSSHQMSEMELIADHLIVIGGGRLLCDMGLGEFIANNSRLEVDLVCSDSVAVAEAIESSGGHILAHNGDELRISGLSARQVGEVVAGAQAVVWELRDVNTSLEEAFMDITRDVMAFEGQRMGGGLA